MIKIYNTLTRRKEIFRPIRKEWVGLYTCGPTVYSYAHIGNMRTYIFEDILRRTLEYNGYRVRHIMNITDVDDKTIRATNAAGEKLTVFTKGYEKIFKNDLKKLNIEFPKKFTRATAHIPAMIRLITVLLKRGFAYRKGDSVYFAISRFKKYGKLAHLDLKGLKAGARVDVDEYSKKAAQDFVLWKGKKEGEPSWKAPFGEGRPGWHIECSAMSMQYLGNPFDFHAAAVDLIFPHHENEIAQSEAATKRTFVRYWVHGEHLLVEGKKMAKSLGNILTLRDIETRNLDPLAYRYLVLTSHYRSKLNFTKGSLSAAQHSRERILDFTKRLRRKNYQGIGALTNFKQKFDAALRNDLDTPAALAALWHTIHQYNKSPARFNSKKVLALFYEFDRVLGIKLKSSAPAHIPSFVLQMTKRREQHRKDEQWQEADALRKEILKQGYSITDAREGPVVEELNK